MEAIPSRRFQYVVPRWSTVAGSQYAFSPASIIALPDARTVQSIGLTLLQAGELAVMPPLIATQEAIRSDMAVYPGGVTWVDAEYDEKLGEALRPLSQNHNLPLGFELADRQKEQLRDAFYLNQISGMPMLDKDMTAYEASQHVQNYIRQARPLFEPMETEYNAALCEETFELILWSGGFGAFADIPEQLQEAEIEFKFKTPLHDAENNEKGNLFLEMVAMTGPAAQLDPNISLNIDVNSAFRDALEGKEIPAEWLFDEKIAAQRIASAQEQQAMAQQTEQMQGIAQAAETAGRAGQELKSAQQQHAI